jgi:hypothetical protein
VNLLLNGVMAIGFGCTGTASGDNRFNTEYSTARIGRAHELKSPYLLREVARATSPQEPLFDLRFPE